MGAGWWITAMLALAAPSTPPPVTVDTAQKAGLDAAAAATVAKRPQAALDAIEPVVRAYDTAYASEKRRIYCGMSPTETLAYMAEAASKRQEAVAVGPSYCDALNLKGYALVDLGRLADARDVYEQLLKLAPMHAHYLAELGQTYRYERNWPKMLELCEQALDVVGLAQKELIEPDRRRAWRCMGYALTEQGKLDAAEALYRKALASDPGDVISQHEMTYIADLRPKQKPVGAP